MNQKNEKYIISNISRLILLLIIMTTFINKSYAYVTVGPSDDSNCDYHSLALAISDVANLGSESIRLVGKNNGYEADGNILMYNKNITITGGYDSCLDTSISHTNPAVISASSTGIPNISMVGISSDFETRLLLVSVHIINGDNDKGGGVKITGNAHLTLNGAEIFDNHASEEGGGIHIKNGKLTINYSSKIFNNESNSSGGGIYCEGGVINYPSGEVTNNNADFGAGLYLDNCQLNANNSNGDKLISHNRGRFGVGMFALGGSQINMGNNSSLTVFEDNQNTDIEDSSGFGGALAIKDQGTTAKLVNSHFKSNKNSSGGAVYAFENAYFSLESSNNCLHDNNYSGCSSIENNKAYGFVISYGGGGIVSCEVAGGHGGAITSHQSTILLDGVSVHHNQSYRDGCLGVDYVRGREPRGSVLYSVSSNTKFIDSLIYRNGGNHSKSIFYVKNSRMDLVQSTISKNRTDVDATIRAVGSSPNIQLWGSIISEGNTDIYDYSSGNNSILMGECNMVSDLSDLTNGGFGTLDLVATIESNPEFVDSSNDDYNLKINSQP